jgi:predicted ester cyclase
MPTDEVRARREKLVLDHFHDEVGAVRGYYHETRVAFPDQRHEMIALRHSDDAVVAEFYLLGTHLGPLGPVPPTGGSFKVRMTAFFVFDENEELVCERVYFDQLSFLRQLLGGVDLKSPKGLLTLARVLRGFAKLSREPKDVIPDIPARTR